LTVLNARRNSTDLAPAPIPIIMGKLDAMRCTTSVHLCVHLRPRILADDGTFHWKREKCPNPLRSGLFIAKIESGRRVSNPQPSAWEAEIQRRRKPSIHEALACCEGRRTAESTAVAVDLVRRYDSLHRGSTRTPVLNEGSDSHWVNKE
jgi:hypothetical protein